MEHFSEAVTILCCLIAPFLLFYLVWVFWLEPRQHAKRYAEKHERKKEKKRLKKLEIAN